VDAERRDDEAVVRQLDETAAVLAREGDRQESEVAGRLERLHEIRRVAARAEASAMSPAAQDPELVGEHLGEVAVVGDRRDQRRGPRASASAGSGSRFSMIGWKNSTATCCASVALPPLPMQYSRPPPVKRSAMTRTRARFGPPRAERTAP
jgi:hypothetical protein